MAKFIALQRHALTAQQIEELKKKGFEDITNVDKILKPDSTALNAALDELALQPGDGIAFVMPAAISIMLKDVAKNRGLRILLAESVEDKAARNRLPFPQLTDEAKAFITKNLRNSVEEKDGNLYALGQMVFNHIQFKEF